MVGDKKLTSSLWIRFILWSCGWFLSPLSTRLDLLYFDLLEIDIQTPRLLKLNDLSIDRSIVMEQVSREQAKRLHHLRKIDQRALRMAAQGTLQQAIQAIMAVRGCTRVLMLSAGAVSCG